MRRTQRPLRTIAAIAALALALPSCDSSSSGPTGPSDSDATVSGEVAQTVGPAATPVAEDGVARFARSSHAADAHTAIVGDVQSGGSVNVLAEAAVQADGSFRIEGVPAGRTDLIVVARSEAGTDVGRVFVHGTTRSGVEARLAPINARTTAQGRVHAHLHASGRSTAARSTGEMAVFLHFDTDATASAVAETDAQIEAMADAYAEAHAAMTQVLAQLGAGLSAEARAAALDDASEEYAQSLHAGASASVAYETYAAAALDALVDAGVALDAIAVATAGSATAMSKVAAQVGVQAAARLSTTRAVTKLNLRARERLATSVEATSDLRTEAQEVATALADARVRIDGAVSLSSVSFELDGTLFAGRDTVSDAVLALASDLSVFARIELEATLDDAFVRADMPVSLSSSASAGAIAVAAASYRAEVEAAAQAVVDAMGDSGASVTVESMTRLLIAAGASGSIS